MPSLSERFVRDAPPWIAIAALVSWSLALWQALPRLMAGPLCTSRSDLFSLVGHCPACAPAVLLTLMLILSLLARDRHKSLLAAMVEETIAAAHRLGA